MGVIRVAFLQLTAGPTVEENLRSGLEMCREARTHGADIALLPEVWSHGYVFPDADDSAATERWRQTAVSEDSEFVTAHRELAAETGLAIGLTYLEAHADGPRNTLSLIDGSGEIVLRYAKVHTCDFTAERLCAPGEGFSVATLQTDKGPLEVGAMICYDRENPESARILAIKGAELVLVPNACIIEEHRVAQMKTRAFENMLALAMTNYPDTHAEGNGRSLGIVPMAFGLGGEKNGQGSAPGNPDARHRPRGRGLLLRFRSRRNPRLPEERDLGRRRPAPGGLRRTLGGGQVGKLRARQDDPLTRPGAAAAY